MSATTVAGQAASEVGAAVWRLAPFLGADRIVDLQRSAEARAQAHAHLLAGDDDIAAEAALDLLLAIWGDITPPVEWWRTPLGGAIASVGALDGSEAVPSVVAAAMLGVDRSRVSQLLSAGKLDRHPDGGVTRASVTARIATT